MFCVNIIRCPVWFWKMESNVDHKKHIFYEERDIAFTCDFCNNHSHPCVPVPHVPASPRPKSPHTRPMSPSPCPRPTFIHSLLVWSLNVMKGHWSTLRCSLLTFSIRREKRCITCKLKDWPWPLAWHPLSNLHWIFGQNSPNSFQTGCANFCGPKTTVGDNDQRW